MTLRGIKFDINDFKTYLIDEEKLSSSSTTQILRVVKSLDAHSTRDSKSLVCGVTYRNWPDGVSYYPLQGPIVEMSYDFFQLRQDAMTHEELYASNEGDDDYDGEIVDGNNVNNYAHSNKSKKKNSQDRKILRNPIKKLERYQQYFYNRSSRQS